MRNAIQVSGSWHGEVWERRKNGELYLKENSVCVVKNAQNKITHYFSIFSDITEKKRNEERINYLAYYDALTGLPNRMLMHKLIDQALAESSRTQQLGALLFIDLNRQADQRLPWAMMWAIACCNKSDNDSATPCAMSTWWRGWAATNLWRLYSVSPNANMPDSLPKNCWSRSTSRYCWKDTYCALAPVSASVFSG